MDLLPGRRQVDIAARGSNMRAGLTGAHHMQRTMLAVLFLAIATGAHADDPEHHSHPVPEQLGTVHFPTSCTPAVGPAFERGIALLHSFAYSAAQQAFRTVAVRDPQCAMAHWGIAMSHFQQLWEPPAGAALEDAVAELRTAADIGAATPRERQYIEALSTYFRAADSTAAAVRAGRYADAMAGLARDNPGDSEAQTLYALALIATAPPSDRTHALQKRAAAILEPIYLLQPQHPGLAHYLIHAYDSAELAPQGLVAARAYARIAPSAPHALHMPSHIFTRLGRWEDSIASNQAARAAARAQGDLGEELHAMDYLAYAYLQRSEYAEVDRVLTDLRAIRNPAAAQFKIGYAATAMPVRDVVERKDWNRAASLRPLPKSAPHVAAMVYWARALGQIRGGHPQAADADFERLAACLRESRAAGNAYWSTQVEILLEEAEAWRQAALGESDAAVLRLRAAADAEDAVEKLPVTPGPIVPAREQLGELLLQLQQPAQALVEFRSALALAPGRRGALLGAVAATAQSVER
jgi:hypothetical protein